MKHVNYSVVLAGLLALMLGGFITVFSTGCTGGTAGIRAIANQTGKIVTLGWFVIDNPSDEVKAIVKKIVVLLGETQVVIDEDKTYSQVLLPIITSEIIPDVPEHLKTIVTAGSISILAGLDMLFASKPEWKKSSEMSILIVSEFCNGVNSALFMPVSDPVYQTMMSASVARMQLQK